MSGCFPITTRLQSEENIKFWQSLKNKQEVMDYLITLLRVSTSTPEEAAVIWGKIRAKILTINELTHAPKRPPKAKHK